MSIIIYKQRFKQHNIKDAPNLNYAHVRYIARRRGVMKNEGMNHGLFGRLEPGEVREFDSWKEIAQKVYKLSKEKKIIYRSIISFDRETAREIDLLKQNDWQQYIEMHISTLAEKNSIKTLNLGFACAVHDERHHPHMHVVFWDKNQVVMKNYVHPSVPNYIRKQLIRDTFNYKIREYLAEKDKSREEIRSVTDADVAEFEHFIKEARPKEYAKVKNWFETFDEDSIYSDPVYGMFNDKQMLPIIAKMFEIKNMIPRDGRIAYKLLPEEVKAKINELVIELLKSNAGLRRAVGRYVDSKMKLAELYASDEKYLAKQKKQFQKEAENFITKRITSTIKSICQKERSVKFSEDEKRFCTEQLLIGLIEAFCRMSAANDRRYEDGHKTMSGELSKLARKEKYLEMKDQGIEP